MKAPVWIGILLAVLSAHAAQSESEVEACLRDNAGVPDLVRYPAQGLATQMFARIGVNIEWSCRQPAASSKRAIIIEVSAATPKALSPSALASATPYEGVHITVFYDRVRKTVAPSQVSRLLAHVLVHEMTHLLQGADRHSDSGVMKVRWTHSDYARMDHKPLEFTEGDVILIRAGLDTRAVRLRATSDLLKTVP